MDFLSIIIVAAIAVWFFAAIRYMIKNKGGCACGSSKKSSHAKDTKECTSCGGCTGCTGCSCRGAAKK